MYSADNARSRRDGAPATKTLTGMTHCKNWVRRITVACVGLVLCSLTLRASADIYLYDGNGTPVNVTSSYTYQEHYVYDSLDNPIGTVDENGNIFNLSNELIGYMTSAPSSPHS